MIVGRSTIESTGGVLAAAGRSPVRAPGRRPEAFHAARVESRLRRARVRTSAAQGRTS
jgi:hypothetical protein